MLLRPVPIPGLFITGTDTEIGKTIIAGAIAQWFARRGARVAVCKPCATGCVRRREGLVSEDAEWLAHFGDASFPLDVICPQRYAEPLAPAVAAERSGKPLDWESIDRSIQLMSAASDVMIVEGVGGLMVPLDARSTVLDMVRQLALPAVVVARPGLGTLNHTLLTTAALERAEVPIAGIVVNRYPAQSASIAEETNLRALERWSGVPVLSVVPDEPVIGLKVPDGITAAIATVDWRQLVIQRR